METFARVGAVALVTALAVWAWRERVKRESQLVQITWVADTVQQALLPEPKPRVGQFDVAASYAAAADKAKVGGDFYKVILTRFGVRGVIGDVSGHGLGVVRTTAMATGVFREAACEVEDLASVAHWMNRSLDRETGPESFTTATVFSVTGKGVWTGLDFGHPLPLLRTADGAVREVALGTGTPLGLGLAPVTPEPVEVRLEEGGELLLMTDGVIEGPRPGRNLLSARAFLHARASWLFAAGRPDRDPAGPLRLGTDHRGRFGAGTAAVRADADNTGRGTGGAGDPTVRDRAASAGGCPPACHRVRSSVGGSRSRSPRFRPAPAGRGVPGCSRRCHPSLRGVGVQAVKQAALVVAARGLVEEDWDEGRHHDDQHADRDTRARRRHQDRGGQNHQRREGRQQVKAVPPGQQQRPQPVDGEREEAGRKGEQQDHRGLARLRVMFEGQTCHLQPRAGPDRWGQQTALEGFDRTAFTGVPAGVCPGFSAAREAMDSASGASPSP
ncbi:PP2C family protein-serine/threonine phosphatase [Streptomyces sp. NPDC056600]|uniref:PP2C family protein-serine/threonine phosphatase n=1 Tax=Streptomyces sp. NPDC056600 TaxID=3345874 RepID=UPI0036CCC278